MSALCSWPRSGGCSSIVSDERDPACAARAIALLEEIDERYLGDEWSAPAFGDLYDGYRSIADTLEGALALVFENDAQRPFFRAIGTRTRKMLGDNPDALYYTAPVRADMTYRVTGNMAGCVYLSFTVELGSADGGYSTQTAGVLRDADFDIAPDGSFEVFFGGPACAANWLALPEGASELIVRCYFEEAEPAAADPNRRVPLTIDPLEPPGPPAPWNDASVCGGFPPRHRVLAQPDARTGEAG